MDFAPLLLSIQISTVGLAFAAVVGIAVAAFLMRERLPGRDLADALITAPMVMPPTVLGYYLIVVLGHKSALGRAWRAVTGGDIVFTRTGLVVAAFLGAFPIVVRSGRAALEGVDVTLVRAARTLGAGAVRAFFTVRLPLAARGILAALLLAWARALGDFGVTLMIGGNIPGETRTAPVAIFDSVLAERDADALVMSLVLTTFAVSILYFVNRLTRRQDAV